MELIEKEKLWDGKFKDSPELINLKPYNRNDTTLKMFRKEFILSEHLLLTMNQYCLAENCSIYELVLTALYIYISRRTLQNNILIGVQADDRIDTPIQVNTPISFIPSRLNIEGDQEFNLLVTAVKNELASVRTHKDFDFNKLLLNLKKRSENIEGLFNIALLQMNTSLPIKDMEDIFHAKGIYCSELIFNIITCDLQEQVCLEINYNSQVFTETEIFRVCEHLSNLLIDALSNPSKRICTLNFLSLEENSQLLHDFNTTGLEYCFDKTIPQLFAETVRKFPDRPAVIFEDKVLTYAELDEITSQFAEFLKQGVKLAFTPNTIVAVMLERSIDFVVCILGVLKAGGAYLPIDPAYPESRIKYMLEDSGAKLLLTQPKLEHRVDFVGEVINVLEEAIYKKYYLKSVVNRSVEVDDLAYVIYTSGSTGNPKGVMVGHRGVSNLKAFFEKQLEVDETDRIIQFASASFDASVWEMFMALLTGAALYIAPEYVIENYSKCEEFLNVNGITIATLPPTYVVHIDPLNVFTLTKLITAGSAITFSLVEKWCERVQYINAYGPTETTVCATVWKYRSSKGEFASVPIGTPISNTQIFIVDEYNNLQPVGAAGELCIAGVGLAKGYLNKPELTSEKFVPNPFGTSEKMYRTGDLARWTSNGNIEFLGRIDNQVKIRGYRIELGEIETQLSKIAGVKEVAVVDIADSDGCSFLCAYTVLDGEISAHEIRGKLSNELPNYMIPAYFIKLGNMPLTPNGKVDKKVLKDSSFFKSNLTANIGGDKELPGNETEERLACLWKELLGIDGIGVSDNFLELGGHSLKAGVLACKIHKEFNVEISVREILKLQTIKKLAKYVINADRKEFSAIEPVGEEAYIDRPGCYQVSSVQKRLFILDQLEDVGIAYNLPVVMEIQGELDFRKFEESLKTLLKRHESLRTSFISFDGQPIQKIWEEVPFNLEYLEVDENQLDAVISEFFRPFDLSHPPLLRAGIVKIGGVKQVLLFDMHHIISDGLSTGILFKELVDIYENRDLPELKIHYKDYAAWQSRVSSIERLSRQEEYWLSVFSGELPVLNLPTDYPRPPVQSFEGDILNFQLNKEDTTGLRKISRELGATLYMILFGLYNVLLHRYTGQEDITVGTTISGRPHDDLQNIIGMFVNTLALRSYPQQSQTFRQFMGHVNETVLNAFENQEYLFEDLIDKLSLSRDPSRNPIFDTMFAYRDSGIPVINIGTAVLNPSNFEHKISKFDLSLDAVENGDTVTLTVEYSTKLFKRETVEKMAGHFINIVRQIIENPDVLLSHIEMISQLEKKQLLLEFNNTGVLFTTNSLFHELIEQQVGKSPEKTALVFENKELTYGELNKKANQLARILRQRGVTPGQIVGIMVDRSLEMVIGILSILKAGGAYLPIDPDYPADRVRYLLEDSKANILLTQQKLMDNVEFSGTVLKLDDDTLYQGDGSNLSRINNSNDLAYIIYTSGTTGNPKGVMVEHQNVVNIALSWRKEYQLNDFEVSLLSIASFSFDVFTGDLARALTNGGKMIICPNEARFYPELLYEIIRKHRVNIIESTPSLVIPLMDCVYENNLEIDCLRVLILGSDVLSVSEFNKLISRFGSKMRILNSYGVTEVTIDSSYYEHLSDENISETHVSVGKPLQNTRFYILNSSLRLQPVGVVGELYIGGCGVTRGYLNKPEMTAEKFISDPFINDEVYNGTVCLGDKMYKTGDLGRWLPDGNLQFLGRTDDQVKIRGFRIEIKEIEHQIRNFKSISEAVVITIEDTQGNKNLCAYIISAEEISIENLTAHLSKVIPDYMIPAFFVRLDKIPLTPNGKIDKKALPIPDSSIKWNQYEPPENESQQKLVKIWEELLNAKNIGITDSFFELGGHSLKAAMLAARIHKEFGVQIPLKQILKIRTIKQQADYIKSAERTVFMSIESAEKSEFYPVTSAQKRMFVLSEFGSANTSYNIPEIFLVEGNLDEVRLEESFNILVERHESLRTSFELKGEEPIQKVHDKVDFKIKHFHVEESEIPAVVQQLLGPFDLTEAPLFRIARLKITESKYVLVLIVHHIISDGASNEILIKELLRLYEGFELPSLRLQYKDYAVWQQSLRQKMSAVYTATQFEREKQYWLKVFSGSIPVLELPTDFPRPQVRNFNGDRIKLNLDNDLANSLKKTSQETGATLYVILFAAYSILLSKYTGQEDIVIGSPISVRSHADLEGIVGLFVNTLAIRNYPSREKTFNQYLNDVKENVMTAFENKHFEFDELVELVQDKRTLGRSPLFDAMFVLQDEVNDHLIVREIKLNPYEFEYKTAKFDLTLEVVRSDEKLLFSLEYSTELFTSETAGRIASDFLKLLSIIVNNTNVKLKDIHLIDDFESLENISLDRVEFCF